VGTHERNAEHADLGAGEGVDNCHADGQPACAPLA
jgi:hypothetical protein